ncbi:MAG: putative toxin-antitoxin system toxin component, PIN family [Deltaproteobacteria bacterium]|nr:putative toxin-antitoxin system toxin component, PIN family [Deltaproteobacteria bacterium]MBW2073115.1 putative toxin-antitoxin system toxin component, PIN family [Deltaproteobacteria bacterium]
MKRVVIDTNVLISALLFGGRPARLIPLWKAGRIQPLASEAVFKEYLKVFSYPRFKLSQKEIDYLISVEILPWFEIITVPTGPPVILDDPEDDKFIWCALSGKAEAIISGDEHMLSVPDPPVLILTPSEFLDKIARP